MGCHCTLFTAADALFINCLHRFSAADTCITLSIPRVRVPPFRCVTQYNRILFSQRRDSIAASGLLMEHAGKASTFSLSNDLDRNAEFVVDSILRVRSEIPSGIRPKSRTWSSRYDRNHFIQIAAPIITR